MCTRVPVIIKGFKLGKRACRDKRAKAVRVPMVRRAESQGRNIHGDMPQRVCVCEEGLALES